MATDSTSGKSARKAHDGFDVEGLRKKVGEVDGFDPVSRIEQHAQIAREGGGIARNIRDGGRFDGCQPFGNGLAEAGAGRIDKNEVWRWPLAFAVQESFGGGLDRFYVARSIMFEVVGGRCAC